MIKNFEIKNTGIFKNANIEELNKISILYAENGRGKTTLAEILQSLQEDDPTLVNSRKTIDSSENPLIKINTDYGEIRFANGKWRNNSNRNFQIFNSNFTDKNIYTGNTINADNRKNLLSFALGENSVSTKSNIEKIEGYENLLRTRLHSHTARLNTICKTQHIEYERLIRSKFGDIDTITANLEDIERKISNSQNIENIKNRNILNTDFLKSKLAFCNTGQIQEILGKTTEDINVEIAKKIEDHNNRFSLDPEWTKNGFLSIKDDKCPFCEQQLEGSTLFEEYKRYFDETYINLNKNISFLLKKHSNDKAELLIAQIKTWEEQQKSILASWQEVDLNSLQFPDISTFFEKINEYNSLINEVLHEKLSSFSSDLREGDKFSRFKALEIDINKDIEEITSIIDRINIFLNNFKQAQEESNLSSLLERKRELILEKTRCNPEVDNLIKIISIFDKRIIHAGKRKSALRTEYTTEIKNVLVNYLDEINKQLDSLNARFSICSINPNFRGSERAEFTISLRNNEINTSDKNNSFRTSLSEGDKRTLSFAFFIAALKSNVRLSDQIVIFDDPFTSLDSNRRRKTLDKIIEISKVCNQVIILTHDEFFARDLFTKINSYNNIQKNKTNGDFVSLKTIEIHPASLDYSEFKELNILKKCRGKYYRNYDLISNFVDTPTDFQERLYEIAKSIRPLLEGYLHRKYPNSFRNGVMLGTIISEIEKGILLGDSIFSFTQDDIETMRDISEYASSFHHDTDVDSPPETIQQHELTQYCKRTLEILHG